MNMSWLNVLAVIASAALGAMGLGGGSILLLYLTLVCDMPQVQAQGINLFFFIPCAVTAVCIYQKRRLLNLAFLLPLILGGFAGVVLGMVLLDRLDPRWIRGLFAAFLVVFGGITFFQKDKKQ